MGRTLVVADVHLTRSTPKDVSEDLARFVDGARGATIFVAGDLFDRSAEGEPLPTFDEVFGVHAALRRALGEHLEAGGRLALAAGNHDAEVGEGGFVDDLSAALGLGPSARRGLATTPWFFREGGLHVEHGHVFDPDNAPAHPLYRGKPALGVRFVHDFIAPTGAYAYLNRNAKLPLELFVEAFTRYGLRGPYVVATFFRAAFSALANAGPFYDIEGERRVGDGRLAAFAAEVGVPAAALREVLASAEAPTLQSLRATFGRLYLDRVAGTVALLGAGALAASGRGRSALAVGGAGALALGASWLTSYNRYAGKVVERLAEGGRFVAEASSADLVVFGHAHHAEVKGKYANPGSFSFSPGEARTYLEVDIAAPRVVASLRTMDKGPSRRGCP